MKELSIKVKNYKCFEDETGFDSIKRVNLIIGRNNSGKSSLLDIIEKVTLNNYAFDQATWRSNTTPQVIFKAPISYTALAKTFNKSTGGGPHINGNHFEFGKQFENQEMNWSVVPTNNTPKFLSCINDNLKGTPDHAEALSKHMHQDIPIKGKVFRRLLAERDINAEKEAMGINIATNGSGITNTIQNFINSSKLPSDLVESRMLNVLNEIFAPDAVFTDIVSQHHGSGLWEIYFEEAHKGRIALSQSGSGLKTVISVLACLFLVPANDKKSLNEYVFGFEELENNIHPALLRRLTDYIYRSSIENDFIYFLTTHSNVLIDQFSKQKDAQIVHVTQCNSISTCKTAATYIDNGGILDDLDVRASDILQANGIIWVEGPSDRIYLNRWINLWSNGELKEGTHYQIVFYGGRLLSHLEAIEPEEVDSGISILNANRNAIMMIDSDKRTLRSPINATKKRIKAEFEAINAPCWVTKGKEIENYISSAVVDVFLEKQNTAQVEQFVSFFDHLDTVKAKEGKKYSVRKSLLAEKLIGYMTKENMIEMLDLDTKMKEVCRAVQRWNS
jgi:putative ATP-dependent endonuclease of OLD family